MSYLISILNFVDEDNVSRYDGIVLESREETQRKAFIKGYRQGRQGESIYIKIHFILSHLFK